MRVAHLLAGLHGAVEGERRGVEVLRQRAARLLRPGLHPVEIARHDAQGLRARADAPVAELARDLERPRPVGRDMDRHRRLEADEAHLPVLEPDRPRHAVMGELDLLAVEEPAHDAEIVPEGGGFHRLVSHDAHGGVARADAEKGAAGREAVDGGDRMRGHRGEPRARYRHAGAEADARGVGGRQRQHGVAVRPDHLAVRRPAGIVAELLGELQRLPLVDLGVDHRAELHGGFLPSVGGDYSAPLSAGIPVCPGPLYPCAANGSDGGGIDP